MDLVTLTILNLPDWAVFSDPQFEFSPTDSSLVGTHKIEIELSDGELVSKYEL